MAHPFPHVRVRWTDAQSSGAWIKVKDIPAPPKVTTRGELVREEKTWIGVSASIADEPDDEDWEWTAGDYTTISRRMIESIEVQTPEGWQPYKKSRKPKI